MLSIICDYCKKTLEDFKDQKESFDFCWNCGKDFCPDCQNKECCGSQPIRSGTVTANFLYQNFGNNPPEYARNIQVSENIYSHKEKPT